ncbi:hypothetical protein OEZ86_001300 [Tetradesmus obliquus]|nr:hypothetical protein OEZ86_001300 [Tetradesmus obliquus]
MCALLNSGTCTPNCCCDPACPAAVVAGFRAASSCLPEGPPPEQLAYCTPEEPFAKVNLPSGDFYHIQKAAADADFWTQLLCIQADRNPSLGMYYPDPPAGDVGTNAQYATCPAKQTPAMLSSNSYSYNQAITVSAPAASGRVRGPFSLPAGALSAECSSMAQVGFMARMPASLKAQSSSCQRTIRTAAALSALCSNRYSPLSPTYYAGLQFPATPASTTLKAINLTSMQILDPATGALTALDPATALVAPNAANGPPAACTGVVLEAQFVFRYTAGSSDSDSGALSSAGVSLVLGNVSMPAGGVPLVLDTAFSVSWINSSAPVSALQPFSGAPGYLPGFPVLAGVLAADPAAASSSAAAAPKAVSRLTGGLQLPAAKVTELLGEWLDELTTQQVVLGIWGNADATRPSQWLPVQSSGWPAATDLEWSEATATCSNVITGFDINIVTGIAFASGNLQSKVLYAQVCFSVGSWSFNQMAGQTLQNFPLQFTASFVPKQQQPPALSLKPAPPLFAPLPPDLFYPFLTSAAERGGQPLGVLVLLAASVALQLLFVDRV